MKQYPMLFNAVYCEPLCISEAAFRSIHAALWPRISNGQGMDVGVFAAAAATEKPNTTPGSGRRETKARPLVDYDTGRVLDERFYWTVAGRPEVAVVPIYGILAKNASWMEETCYGITDINAIAHAIAQAAAAKEIKTIVLDLGTPGGQTTGIPELAGLVKVARSKGKTVYAFSDELCASAGYWIGSQAQEFYATQSSTIGSIGTYLAFLDESLRMQLQGVRLEFFGAGEHKGMGLPGKPLSQADRELLQARVDEINGWFLAAVRSARPKVSQDTMQGQVFSGVQAEQRGLIDGLVSGWDEFLKLI